MVERVEMQEMEEPEEAGEMAHRGVFLTQAQILDSLLGTMY